MLTILNQQASIANQFLLELRDTTIQKDRERFRKNVTRLGELMASHRRQVVAQLRPGFALVQAYVGTELGAAVQHRRHHGYVPLGGHGVGFPSGRHP